MVAQQTRLTDEEYLALDRAYDWKYELVDGILRDMPHPNAAHVLITGNVVVALHNSLADTSCHVYASRMRIKTPSGMYAFPDVLVVRDEPILETDVHDDTLLNPTLIIEVLSPSTALYDRAEKFDHYRTLPSLQEYVLVAQDKRRVERYVRQTSGVWALSDVVEGDGNIELTAIDCQLAIEDIYNKVAFETDTTPTNPGSPI